MDIEIIENQGGHFRLWDGSRFLADCGKGPEGEERAKVIWDEIKNLQMANDELKARVGRDGLIQSLRRFAESAGVEFEQTDAEHWAWRMGDAWQPAYVAEGGAIHGAIRYVFEEYLPSLRRERDQALAQLRTAEQEWAAIVRRKEGELSEARGELALVHGDHKRVLVQLTKAEEEKAQLVCEMEAARERHNADVATLKRAINDTIDSGIAEIQKGRQRNAQLVAALEPFARFYEAYQKEMGSRWPDGTRIASAAGAALTRGDLRRAAEAIKEVQG